MVKEKYIQEEIFTIPWIIDIHGQWSLDLFRVGVVYKVKLFKRRFHLWVRCQKNTPYKLGVFFSLAEAQFRVYDHTIYFGIYHDGSWDPRSERKKYEMA